MASFLPPTITTYGAPFSSPFFKKTLPVPSLTRNHKHSFKVSCKAKDNEKNGNLSQGKFDRRDMLIGLGGLYGATGLVTDPLALAAPISAPDVKTCVPPDLSHGPWQTHCCLPETTQIVDFEFPSLPNAMRVRPAAHLVDEDYIAKFSKALQIMRGLPDSDPRSFKQQAAVHCAYCDGAYHQVGFPKLKLQVHGGWIFFPFHRQVVSNGTTPKLFMGKPYRAGDHPSPGAGSLEFRPHNTVHVWCGDPCHNLEDMGNFYSAGFDPIFYAHHSNVDRIWSIWKTLGGKRQDFTWIKKKKRQDFTDPDWLHSSFVFYDENAQLTRVKVKDCLDTTKLGYRFQHVDIPWLKKESKPTPRTSVRAVNKAAAEDASSSFAAVMFPAKLDKTVKVMVPRPRTSRTKEEKEEEDEVLLIDGIEVGRDVFVKFDVFIQEDDETMSGPQYTEFAGSFVNVPHSHNHDKKMKTSLRLGISELLEELGAEADENLLVTLVPRNGAGDVSIEEIKIEFD